MLASAVLVASTQPLLAGGGGPQLTTIATGLNNPRGLSFGSEGTLYVAEAGTGAGDGHGGFGTGVGLTGSITEISHLNSPHPKAHRIVTGLVSFGTAERGPEVVGADGIDVQGDDDLYVIMAESAPGILADVPGVDPKLAGQFGQLLKIGEHGRGKSVADVGSFTYAWTDAHQNDPWAPKESDNSNQFPDSNPYAVLSSHGRQYVVDAGANTVSEVDKKGKIRLIAYLPDPLFPPPAGGPPVIHISDSVPTCIAEGPDGYLYVGTLAFGANFARFGGPPLWATLPKQSKVYRIDPKSNKFFLTDADVWADDLNPLTGCAFGPDGSLFVTEFLTESTGYTTGDVVKIQRNPNGTAGARTALGVGALHSPNGLAVGRDGSVYVSNNSTSTGAEATPGEVVRVNY